MKAKHMNQKQKRFFIAAVMIVLTVTLFSVVIPWITSNANADEKGDVKIEQISKATKEKGLNPKNENKADAKDKTVKDKKANEIDDIQAITKGSNEASNEKSNAGELDGKLVILHTNDVHGGNINGYAKLAAMKKEYESKGADVMIVDAGDFTQGSRYVDSSKGDSAADLINAVGYDLVGLGQLDFIYGQDILAKNIEKIQKTTGVICSNVFKNGESIVDQSKIIEKGEIKVGFVGITSPETQNVLNPEYIEGLQFLNNETTPKLYDNVKDQIQKLKNDGAETIIGLTHLGVDSLSEPYTSYDLLENVSDFDYILDGKSHSEMTEGKMGEPILQTGTSFANVGKLVIDENTKQIESKELIDVNDYQFEDDTVKAMVDKIKSDVDEEYGKTIAKSEVRLNGDKKGPGNRDSETNLGDLVTDAMKSKAKNIPVAGDVPDDNLIAIINGGSIRASINPGDVSKNDMLLVLPYGNWLSVLTMKGSDLLEALEAATYCTPDPLGSFPQASGIDFTVNTSKPYDEGDLYPGSTYHKPNSIQRVTINSINGKEFDPNAIYKVGACDFIAKGGDTYYVFTKCLSKTNTGLLIDSIVTDYIQNQLKGVIDKSYENPRGTTHIVNTEHTVTFMNGDKVYKTEKVVDYTKVTKPEDPKPEKEGTSFIGWFDNEKGTGEPFDFGELITADTTLFAIWSDAPTTMHTVTFNSQGGTDVPAQTVEHGECAAKPEAPTKTGFTFNDWFTTPEATGSAFDFDTPITQDLTLYADWSTTPVDTVSLSGHVYDKNSKEPIAGAEVKFITAESNKEYSTVTDANGAYKIENITKGVAGKLTFSKDGFMIAEIELSSEYMESSHENEDVALEKAYKVTFEMNGHGIQIDPQTVKEGDKANKPADPTEEGYTFNGWFTDKELTKQFDFNTAINTDITLYAKWTKNLSPDPTPIPQGDGSSASGSPQTGDSFPEFAVIGLALLALISGGCVIRKRAY